MERVCGGLREHLDKIMNEQYMSPVNAGKITNNASKYYLIQILLLFGESKIKVNLPNIKNRHAITVQLFCSLLFLWYSLYVVRANRLWPCCWKKLLSLRSSWDDQCCLLVLRIFQVWPSMKVTQVQLSFHVLHDGKTIYIYSMQVYSRALLQWLFTSMAHCDQSCWHTKRP